MMRSSSTVQLVLVCCSLLLLSLRGGVAEDPYQYEDWTVSFVTASPLGVSQKYCSNFPLSGGPRVISITNGHFIHAGPLQRNRSFYLSDQFPGPQLETTTNYNLAINVHNELDEPLLITWDGIQLRRNAWQDGVGGTNCPIQPGGSWSYHFKVKDQIGSFHYHPSLLFQKAAGGFGSIRINPRPKILTPFDPPADDFALLIGDWYNTQHQILRNALDYGHLLWPPDGILINGKGPHQTSFTVEQGKTYRFRISNVGLTQTLNLRIQGHRLLLVETEGCYVAQTYYSSLDVHLGQSYAVLVTMDHSIPADLHIVASTRFGWNNNLFGLAVLRYNASEHQGFLSEDLPPAPTDVQSSLEQARSIRLNLTTGAARLQPQGSYHYGQIPITKTYILSNAPLEVHGKQRFMVNGVTFVRTSTPLKLADYLRLEGVFRAGSIPEHPITTATPSFASSVLSCPFRAMVELVFQNVESTLQSWHLDGYAFFVVGMGPGSWNEEARRSYNLVDAVARTTTQVYGNHWTVVLVELNNPGLWNLRSQELQRQWLGQELYMRVDNPPTSDDVHRESPPPHNLLLCGKALVDS